MSVKMVETERESKKQNLWLVPIWFQNSIQPSFASGEALKMDLTDSNFKKSLEGKNVRSQRWTERKCKKEWNGMIEIWKTALKRNVEMWIWFQNVEIQRETTPSLRGLCFLPGTLVWLATQTLQTLCKNVRRRRTDWHLKLRRQRSLPEIATWAATLTTLEMKIEACLKTH